MNLQEAETIYLAQVERTNELINSMGDNPQAINAFITNTYAALSQQNPAFSWFSLGAAVSNKVGQNLQFSAQTSIHSASQMSFAEIVLDKFGAGNQAIFKNISTLFLTYESIGIEGVKLLTNSNINNPFKNEFVLEAILYSLKMLPMQYCSIYKLVSHRAVDLSVGSKSDKPKTNFYPQKINPKSLSVQGHSLEPSYRLNHEFVDKIQLEGSHFSEQILG